MEYRKIPIISPGLILVQKAFFVGLIFGGGDVFSERLVILRNFAFQCFTLSGFGLSMKTAKNTKIRA